mmetsp:Transcript_56727/g.90352  ORF Transcript_56727/g.90352 Transcript_56727/m.90352 type:complete len:452 (-) Transcript_56727:930-2285(-)
MADVERRKPGYEKISAMDDDEHETDSGEPAQRKKKKKTFIQRVLQRPLAQLPLLYFLLGIAISIANGVFYFMDQDTAFIVAGILGAAICIYAVKHFHTLIGLKQQIDSFGALNMKFIREQRAVSREVDRVTAAVHTLRDTRNRIQASTEQNRQNLEAFQELQDHMQAYGKQSLDELGTLQLKSKQIAKKWHDQLFQHQSNLLHTVFDRMERQGSRMGMTQEEFNEFELQLPGTYRERFDRLGTFHQLSKNDSLIDYSDFREVLDLFAEMATDDVDIDFKIEKTPKPKKKKSMKPKPGQQIKFREMEKVHELEAESKPDSQVNTNLAPKGLAFAQDISQDISVDLEDVTFSDQEQDDLDDHQIYQRQIVITRRTLRSRRFDNDRMLSLFDRDESPQKQQEDENEEEEQEQEDEESGGPRATPTFKKGHVKVGQVQFKSVGSRHFEHILDGVD